MPNRSEDTSRSNNSWERLEKQALKIIYNWEEKVRQELPAARRQTPTVLRDGLTEFLINLARDLTPPRITSHPKGSLRLAKHHGKERATVSEYSLEQVLLEYHLLRKSIIEILRSTGPLSDHEQEVIHDSIDRGIAEAGEAFMEMKLAAEKENFEKIKREKEIRDQLIYTITHDLRSPLAAANLSAQSILRNPETVGVNRKLCITIIDNIKRIDRMIQDLLDSSRIQAGQKIALRIDHCDLRKVTEAALNQASTIYGDRFILQSPESVLGYWDSNAIQRVLENLIQNAVKYGSEDAPITIILTQSQEGTQLAVHNQGSPIPEKDQSTLFEPFHRIIPSDQDKKEGWGIGLSIVRGIAEAHGGQVEVHSSQKGTTFTVHLKNDSRWS